MIKNSLSISLSLISIYILLIIIPYNLNLSINKNRSKEINKTKQELPIIKLVHFGPFDKEDKEDKEDEEDEEQKQKDEEMKKNLTSKINEMQRKIVDVDNEISKRKIYIIFLSIITFILFIMLIIYSSIKCFVLCTKKNETVYRVSELNRFGEVYIDDSVEEKNNNKSLMRSDNYGAPRLANDKNNSNTFNPDTNYIDKNLYKPYSSRELH